MHNKLSILTFVAYYLPGYKAGGPLRTIAHMVDHLSDEFDFFIVTTDRDLGANSPYAEIQPNRWQRVGGAMVYYLAPEKCSIKRMAKLIVDTPYDVLYLNSFFDPVFSFKPLLARRFGWLPDKPVIVAPRGEFSTGAIKLKYLKKYLYIKFVKLFHLYYGITWQASSNHEAQDIVRIMNPSPSDIKVASDLPSRESLNIDILPFSNQSMSSTDLRIVFVSRISRKKNLDYALKVLCKVKTSVHFDIYGPIEDAEYWKDCQGFIKQMPSNVSVNYKGSVHPDNVAAVFGDYDLFFFPTRGENYGHVIVEALSSGTLVLLSDQTPWRKLHEDRIGWDLPLEDSAKFVNIIDELPDMIKLDKNSWRTHIRKKILERLADPQILWANRELFRKAVVHNTR